MTLDDSVRMTETGGGGIDNLELSLELKAVLKVLTDEEREIVMLKTVNEYTSREISDITGIPHATVRSKLSRALSKMRKELEKGGDTDE
jgi:RNA polymerase sigma-70 factor (ECF subfamily)